MAQICVRENTPLITLATKHLKPDLAADLARPKAIFTRHLYQTAASGDIFDQDWNDYRVRRQLYAAGLEQSGREPRAPDLLWIPTAHPPAIAGLADWLIKHSVCARVALGFHSLLRPVEPGSVEELVHRLASRRLIEAVGQERIFTYATNHKLAQRLATAMNVGIYLAPRPHFYSPSETTSDLPALPPGNGPLVAYLGEPRHDKSELPLLDIVREALRRRRNFHFVLQIANDETDSAVLALRKMPQVKPVKGWLDDGAFIALIQAVDMLLLPYKRARYTERISGPFAFAAAHGRPLIVPYGTWMAERIARKNAAGVAYKRDATVIEALTLAADRLPALHAQAAKLAQRWRIWDGEALPRVVRQWAAGNGTGELRRVDPQATDHGCPGRSSLKPVPDPRIPGEERVSRKLPNS